MDKLENKVFSLNGNDYRLKRIDLGVLNKAAPLLLKFRRLQYEYTKDIDDTELRKAKAEIEDIKTAISQIESGDACDGNEISGLKKKLTAAETELKNSGSLQAIQRLVNDAESLALFELFTDMDTILPFLKNVLDPVNGKIPEVSLDEPDALVFIKEVVTDFFALTLRSKGRSLS